MKYTKPIIFDLYQDLQIPKTFIKKLNLTPPTLNAQNKKFNNSLLYYYYPNIFPMFHSSVLLYLYISFLIIHYTKIYFNRIKYFFQNIYIYRGK
jgi:hypothetical protein